jgi:hypothetical protein
LPFREAPLSFFGYSRLAESRESDFVASFTEGCRSRSVGVESRASRRVAGNRVARVQQDVAERKLQSGGESGGGVEAGAKPAHPAIRSAPAASSENRKGEMVMRNRLHPTVAVSDPFNIAL